ncbi:MAG: TetR/AcrR family transcriptional regulator [Actinomycetota bacterium]
MKTRSALAQATMDRIVDATIAAIEAGGEPALRVNDIARDSDVSVATLYHYFGDREGLVVAARQKQYAGSTGVYYEGFSYAVRSATTCGELSKVLCEFFGQATAESSRAMRFLRAEIIGSSCTRPQLAAALRDVQEDLARKLTVVFTDAQDRGLMRNTISAREIAEFALSIHLGSVLHDLLAPDSSPSTSLDPVFSSLIESLLVVHS